MNAKNDQWREVANFIEQNVKPTDLILINSIGASVSSMKLPFDFYFKGTNIVYGVQTSSNLTEIVSHRQYSNTWLIIYGLTDPYMGLFTEYERTAALLKTELERTSALLLTKEYVSRSVLNSIWFTKYPLITVVTQKIIIYYYASL